MTKKPLGRGLSALLSTPSSLPASDEVLDLEIDLIIPNEQQPRSHFDHEKLEELAQSIRASGVIQHILVRRKGQLFELIAGERRWRAGQLAGLTRIPAIIRAVEDDKLLELALIENIQREELNPIEEANAYRKLIESLELTQEAVADRVGRDRTYITNYLRVLKLPSEIQALLETEKLSFGHARALLGMSDLQLQRRFAQRIVKHNWSVRETERRIRNLMNRPAKLPAPPAKNDPNIRAAEAKLRRRFGTQVKILVGSNGLPGKIEIEFYNPADLNRIYERMLANDTASRSVSAASSL